MRFFYKKIITDSFKLFVWHNNKKINWLEKNTLFDVKQYKKIKNISRKTEWLGTRFLLQNISNHNNILYSKSGKPYIKNNNISISHSKKLIGITISNHNIGLDIQKIDPRINLIQSKFINDFELTKRKIKEKNIIIRNTILWTIKEAVCKYLDDKNIIFKKEILVNKIDMQKKETFVFAKRQILKTYFCVKEDYIITYLI